MSEYLCPNCKGGFERPRIGEEKDYCLWCDQPLDGGYEFEPRVATVSKTESGDQVGLLKRLVK